MTEANHLKALIHEVIKELSEFPVSGATLQKPLKIKKTYLLFN
jgi:hypothetical protein